LYLPKYSIGAYVIDISMLPQLTKGVPLLPALTSKFASFADVRCALLVPSESPNSTELCSTVQQINDSLRGRTVKTTYTEDIYVISGKCKRCIINLFSC
jgi:hypothetical protein